MASLVSLFLPNQNPKVFSGLSIDSSNGRRPAWIICSRLFSCRAEQERPTIFVVEHVADRTGGHHRVFAIDEAPSLLIPTTSSPASRAYLTTPRMAVFIPEQSLPLVKTAMRFTLFLLVCNPKPLRCA